MRDHLMLAQKAQQAEESDGSDDPLSSLPDGGDSTPVVDQPAT
jgi:hypothetical protein